MFRGQLMIEKTGRVFVVMLGMPPLRRMIVEPESILEIHLGSAWIEGKYSPEYKQGEPIKTHLFVCRDDTFCRLESGMDVRLPDIEPVEERE